MSCRPFFPVIFLTVAAIAPAEAVVADQQPVIIYDLGVVAEGLDHPWSIAFLPDGSMLVTERAGRLRLIRSGQLVAEPVANTPTAFVDGQGGYFDVVLHPEYSENRTLYLTLSTGEASANATIVVRARYNETANALEDVTTIFTASPLMDTSSHYGGRMAFLPDGTFVLTLGDGFNYRERAQQLDNDFGKFVRLNDDGSVPQDNPFIGREGARPEIYSYGYRNPQAIVYDAVSGRLYAHEHGPQGGDEINIILPGRNYGWPAITYGLDYSGAIITPFTELPGMEQPIHYWTPSIAPSGMAVYNADLFAQWKGDLLVTGLVSMDLRRIDMEGGVVKGEEILLAELGERLRDVRVGPDGALYVLTDSDTGRVLRMTPKP